jgi:excisionase family DNA binding protein
MEEITPSVKYIPIREACQRLRRSRNTIVRWIRDGKIKAFKKGYFIFIPESELEHVNEAIPYIPPQPERPKI